MKKPCLKFKGIFEWIYTFFIFIINRNLSLKIFKFNIQHRKLLLVEKLGHSIRPWGVRNSILKFSALFDDIIFKAILF